MEPLRAMCDDSDTTAKAARYRFFTIIADNTVITFLYLLRYSRSHTA